MSDATSEIEKDLDEALTAMSEAGVSAGWSEADCRAVLKSIDEAYRRLYVRASQRDALRSPGTTETGTRDETEILRGALRSIIAVVRAEPAGTVLDTVYGIARDAFDAARSLAALPVSRGEATATMGQRVRRWVETCFGPSNMARNERAARLAEETIELAQAEGVPESLVERIVRRVYERPAGEPGQEGGGVAMCLLGWAEAAGQDHMALALREIERVESLPVEHFRKRHQAKVDAGSASPSPGSETPRGAGLGTCPHGYDRAPWLCDHCRRAIPSPSLPGDNHAEKEE